MSQTKAEKAAYRMARYALHRMRGHCVRCPAASGRFVLCLDCRKKDSVYGKQRRDKATAARVAQLRQDMPRIVASGRKVAA